MASRRRTSKRSRRSKSPKRTRSKGLSKRSSRRSKTRKSKSKRPLNKYFKMMLDARKRGLPSFTYNGKTYTDKSGSGFYKRGR